MRPGDETHHKTNLSNDSTGVSLALVITDEEE